MKQNIPMVKCSCGNTIPKRWIEEGKAVNSKTTGSYCIRCADDSQYSDLVNRFAEYIKTTKTS